MNSYTNEDEIREIKATLESLIVLVRAIGDQLVRIESSLRNVSPTTSERLQAVAGSKSSTIANLPSIGSLTTNTK